LDNFFTLISDPSAKDSVKRPFRMMLETAALVLQSLRLGPVIHRRALQSMEGLIFQLILVL